MFMARERDLAAYEAAASLATAIEADALVEQRSPLR
jgi:hypothetical protein